MILKASQRGGANALALHLLNAEDNEHIDVHAITGFMATDVQGALQEIEAIARATKCKQPLFSLSLSPPKDAVVPNQDFEDAVEQALIRTGLAGQPHVVIFHEKHGRRHAHVVVSRIDTNAMKAINLSFFKDRLMELSRELYVTHGWDMPKGHEDRTLSDPLNYSLEEYQVAQRAKRDPQITKAALQAAWAQSDSKASFAAALQETGYVLARGDRRGFLALDADGNVYSLSRWLGVKTKELKARLGDPAQLPSIEQASASLKSSHADQPNPSHAARLSEIEARIQKLTAEKASAVQLHRTNRVAMNAKHEQETTELIRSFSRSQKSLRGLFQWVSGKRAQVVATHRVELNALHEKHGLAELALSAKQCASIRSLRENIKALKLERDGLTGATPYVQSFDLVRPRGNDALFTAAQIRKQPARILQCNRSKSAFPLALQRHRSSMKSLPFKVVILGRPAIQVNNIDISVRL